MQWESERGEIGRRRQEDARTERVREGERETERDREKERGTERKRERQSERERQRDRESDNLLNLYRHIISRHIVPCKVPKLGIERPVGGVLCVVSRVFVSTRVTQPDIITCIVQDEGEG